VRGGGRQKKRNYGFPDGNGRQGLGMAGNLKARLARIRTGETPRTDAESKAQSPPPRDETKSGEMTGLD